MCNSTADIIENDWLQYGYGVLECLLWEHGRQIYKDEEGKERHHHICWGTDNYKERGAGYGFFDEITVESVIGENTLLIRPRALKSREEQEQRTRDKAEVFTPSWVCNAQNNLIDEAWFGRKDVFNTEYTDEQGKHLWRPTKEKITFPVDKTWKDYVCDTRLEMACGEAPYLVSLYDTTTGDPIPIEQRIGLLDRKLRVVGENVENAKDWICWAKCALKSIYGFEWQGDNLLLARESVLRTFMEYYAEFAEAHDFRDKRLRINTLQAAAYIISWNIFQMDGIKMVLPMTCHDELIKGERQVTLFDEIVTEDRIVPCPGCKKNDIHSHNGIYQRVADWSKDTDEPIEIVEFHTLVYK